MGTARPAIDNLVFVITPDASVRYQKLKTGECHVMAYPNPADIEALSQDTGHRDDPARRTWTWETSLSIPRKRRSSSRDVRRAISLAVDKAAILEAVYLGVAGMPAHDTRCRQSLWSHDATIRAYAYDPEAARRLLAQAGYPDGFTTTLWALPGNRPYLPNGAARRR